MTFGTGAVRRGFLELRGTNTLHTTQSLPMLKRHAIALAAASLFAFGANAQESSGGIMGVAAAGDTIAVHAPDTGGTREPPRPAVFPKPKPRPAVSSSKREERRKGSLFDRELFRIVIR